MLTIFKRSNTNPNNLWVLIRTYCATGSNSNPNNLYSRISPLENPNLSIVSVLHQWVQEGQKVRAFELRRIIRDLRGRKRYTHALEVRFLNSSS
ncbi:Pentatricopeptide repeat-containing protein [Camellia lanceoleosa]|uniref:Pentatricopeptide repeat-containing protein n=1 Tax=Camellia lanceoleosa TaxID=1840588 RepID=A0ACC0HYD9_9ERIC|nr:Pentatricopeptide repeat-containing protein [Camellia lanceoleosa]